MEAAVGNQLEKQHQQIKRQHRQTLPGKKDSVASRKPIQSVINSLHLSLPSIPLMQDMRVRARFVHEHVAESISHQFCPCEILHAYMCVWCNIVKITGMLSLERLHYSNASVTNDNVNGGNFSIASSLSFSEI